MSPAPLLQNFRTKLYCLLQQIRQPKRNGKLLEKSLLLALLSVLFPLSPPVPAKANSNLKAQTTNLPKRLIFLENFNPPGNGQPPETSGAGSRDGRKCAVDESPIQPLMPDHNFGLTFYQRPPVFIRLPKTSAQKVVLTFRDQVGEYTEYAVLPITKQGDVMSFALPNDKIPLTVGKNYQWILAVVCGESGQPDDPVFSGWVQRVNQPAKLQELSRKTPLQQAQWYGAHGYWYDMLNVIVQERRSHPNDAILTSLWQDFLKSLQLDASISNH
jgi:hypothetical protein